MSGRTTIKRECLCAHGQWQSGSAPNRASTAGGEASVGLDSQHLDHPGLVAPAFQRSPSRPHRDHSRDRPHVSSGLSLSQRVVQRARHSFLWHWPYPFIHRASTASPHSLLLSNPAVATPPPPPLKRLLSLCPGYDASEFQPWLPNYPVPGLVPATAFTSPSGSVTAHDSAAVLQRAD